MSRAGHSSELARRGGEGSRNGFHARPPGEALDALASEDTAADTLGRPTMDVSRDRRREPGRFGSMVGASPAMQRLFDRIVRVAPTDATVLILGESGTGKELVAESVHRLSRRCAHAMISVNCGAISANLIESELFGHERGSFTGADRTHRGHFERADGGTLFLDEVSEMPQALQVKLLRVLESGTFSRVGGDRPIKVSVRIVAAAKPDLELAALEGRFRTDLLYRLKVFPIGLPPLRERAGDLALLAGHFLAALNLEEGSNKRLTPAALDLLEAHAWPGNVRELRHTLERAFILSDAEITPELLSDLPSPRSETGRSEITPEHAFALDPGMPLAHAQRVYILATLDRFGGNKRTAASRLQISVKTLYTRLREYEASGHWPRPRGVPASAAVRNP